MNTAGGASWATAGTIDSSGTTPATHLSDLSAGPGDPPTYSYWLAWWTITMGADTLITLDGSPTTAIDADHGDCDMWVYTGPDEASAVEYVVDYDSGTNFRPKKTFVAQAGVTYHVVLGTWDDTGNGLVDYIFDVTAETVVPPVNDNIADAIPISLNDDMTLVVAGATTEPGEDTAVNDWTYRSVWFTFTPDFTGMLGFDIFTSDSADHTNPEWSLWTGTGYGDLVQVGDYGYGLTNFHVDVEAGTPYLLRIAPQDEVTNIVEIRLRRLEWGDWIQDPDHTLSSSTSIRSRQNAHTVAQHNTTFGWSSNHEPEQRAWAQAALSAQYADMMAAFNGYDDSWITDATVGSPTDPLQTTGSHLWTAHQKMTTGGLSNVQGQTDLSQGICDAVSVRAASSTYDSFGTVEYESDRGKIVGATLAILVTTSRGTSSPITISGQYEVKAYVPTLDDFTLLDTPFLTKTIVDLTTISGTTSAVHTLELTEDDFAEADTSLAGVILWCPLHVSDATVVSSNTGTDSSASVRADVHVNNADSSWIERPPRYRLIQVVEGVTGPPPPCHLYPRDDDLGVGTAAIWPPASSQQASDLPGAYY